MKRTALALACAALIAACSSPQDTQNQAAAPAAKPAAPAAPAAPAPAAAPAAATPLVSGIDLKAIEPTVAPGADFYQHVNGKCLDTVEIPADKGKYGTGTIVFDKIQEDLHSVVDDAAAGKSGDAKADTRKIGDLYASFMDEAALEAQDIKPLQARFASRGPTVASRSFEVTGFTTTDTQPAPRHRSATSEAS